MINIVIIKNQPHPLFINKKTVIFFAVLCCFLWGSAYPAIKNGYILLNIAASDTASQVVFAGYRFFFAGVVLLFYFMLSQRTFPLMNGLQTRHVLLLGLGNTTIQYIFFYIGLAYATGVNGSIVNSTTAFFGVLLAHYLYKNDKLSINKMIGCFVGFLGVLIVSLGVDQYTFYFSFTLKGEGFVLLSAFLISAAGIYGKYISQTMDTVIMTGYQLAFGGLTLIISGYLFGGKLGEVSVDALLLLSYLIFLSAVSFSVWSVLLKYNRVSMIVPFTFLVPVFGASLSAIFLDEQVFVWKNALALLFVCSGILLVNKAN